MSARVVAAASTGCASYRVAKESAHSADLSISRFGIGLGMSKSQRLKRSTKGRGTKSPLGVELGGNERGAISLIGLFMIVFMVGILYYVVGTAEAIFQRERLQDSTDAAVMAGAIVQAQAMNFIVLLNIAMSVILAVLIAVQMVKGVAEFGMVVALGLAWPTAGASLALVPPLKSLESAMESLYETLKPSADEAMVALHNAADSVKDFAPQAASQSAQSTLAESSLGLRGFAAGPSSELPIEDAPYSTLCDKAGDVVGEFATTPFHALGVDLGLLGIEGLVQSITSDLASYFCAEDGASAPVRTQMTSIAYPQMDWDRDCEASASRAKDTVANAHDADDPLTTPECVEAEAKRRAAMPDEATGECLPEKGCSRSEYQEQARAARAQCIPTLRQNLRATSYLWRKGTVDYVYTGETWKRQGPPTLPVSEYRNEAQRKNRYNLPPCGDLGNVQNLPRWSGGVVEPVVSTDYNLEPYPDGDVGEVAPVCAKEEPLLTLFDEKPEVGEIRKVDYEEVTHIFGCAEQVERELDLSGAERDDGGGSDQRPKQIIEDIELGDERFQVWSVLERAGTSDDAAKLVRLPLWGRVAPDSPLADLRWLGRYGLAQSEFYYAGVGGRDEWMWNMNWRARLRRFAWPEDDEHQGNLLDTARASGVSQMGELDDVLRELRSAIAH